MSGFSTIIRDNGLLESDNENIKIMNKLQIHRGPDNSGYYIGDNIAMGSMGLVTDDDQNVPQPLFYKDRYHIVFDGKIYNNIEIRDSLTEQGVSFTTNSDAEVVVALFDQKGPDLLDELRGMFSFLIWDEQNQSAFVARDKMGIKPLYYYEYDGGLIVASEKKSINVIGENSIEINDESLHHYMSFQFVPEPNVMEKDILKLEAGHFLEKKLDSKSTMTKYYNIIFKMTDDKFEDKVARIRSTVEESVAKHMEDNDRIGCQLSGGIDSTIMLALARKHNPNIKTFTVGFDIPGYNEIEHAQDTARQFGLENISKIITSEEYVNKLAEIIWYLDDPLADPAAIAMFYASREASEYTNILITGEGSDELFGGYNIYREPISLKGFSNIPNPLKNIMLKVANILPEGTKGKSFIERGCTPLEERFIGNASIFNEKEKQLLLKNYNKVFNPQRVTKPLYDQTDGYDLVSKMQYIDLHTWMNGDILQVAERMTIASSIEIRAPFLDQDVIDVALDLNYHDRVDNNTTKHALREAFRDIIPNSVYDRKKLGIPVPIRVWLKDELYDWAKNIIKSSNTDDIINKDYALQLLDKHRQGKLDYSRKIWTILIFMIWYKVHVEKDIENLDIAP